MDVLDDGHAVRPGDCIDPDAAAPCGGLGQKLRLLVPRRTDVHDPVERGEGTCTSASCLRRASTPPSRT